MEDRSPGRPPLPGIPRSMAALDADKVYKERCDDEDKYLRRRNANPPPSGERIGKVRGFDVVKRPSYVKVHRTASTVPSTRSHPGSSRSSSGRGAMAGGQPSPVLTGGSLIASGSLEVKEARLKELADQIFVYPKYALTQYTMHHMQDLERTPTSSRSATFLKRAISEPTVNAKTLPHSVA
mmetsp:Transcript_96069/g.222713  ORF Transcript_96069/g.222713 Transcript_96069/m.222713 type:complete len:181 (-) Transcript_96069:51-593(-)